MFAKNICININSNLLKPKDLKVFCANKNSIGEILLIPSFQIVLV